VGRSRRANRSASTYHPTPLRLLGEGQQYEKKFLTTRFLHPKATQHATQSQFY
jgi:hypothetical protein